MDIKISVIFAVSGGESNLEAALDAVRAQTLRDIEVLLIDAASNDGSEKIMNSFLSDKRFKYYKLAEGSVSRARNYGIGLAKGKYVSFADAAVIFTKDLLERMYSCAEKEDADLCVAPMASSDIYGKHIFKSTGILSRRKVTDKFDADLVWNPAVTNKLFKREKINRLGLEFSAFGKAREAAFTLPFAFESEKIVCSSKGAASYVIPVADGDSEEFPIQNYLDAYAFILKKAHAEFERAVDGCVSDFERKELVKRGTCYIDELLLKEITVLLYSYYRHFWLLPDESIKEYTEILGGLIEKLSSSGKKRLFDMNKDIFFDGKLIDTKAEMAQRPRVTVCIGKSERHYHLHEKRLEIQVASIFNQTMPCFELLVDSRLRGIFPRQWIDFPNVRFIDAYDLGGFKDSALEQCRTKYIMYQDGFARLNPKILMRHYDALAGREKYGFSTSPLTQFDGKKTKEYSFSDLSFYSSPEATRARESRFFVLDLFFCNKLFRTEHLNGIKFSFSDNPVADMYKLYEHSRFKKLSHRGAYFPYSEQQALDLLKEQESALPPECKRLYENYGSVYFKAVTLRKKREGLTLFLKKAKGYMRSLIGKAAVLIFSSMKIRNRAFFYSIRSDGRLLENAACVYDACKCKKVVFAKMLPHSLLDIFKVKYYMLTSRVIVTDDYLKYLRQVKLREGQKVVQLWHASGAFKRFGLDAPSRLTRIEEFNTHSQYTDVCVSSEYVRQFYAHAFGVELDVIKPVGSPRTDDIVRKTTLGEKKERLCSKHPLLRDKKVYVYFPTFRETDGLVTDFDPKIDWDRLNDELLDDEVFIVSRHPVMENAFFKEKFYSRLKDYTFEPTSELLAAADVVVTDYSSIIFDAALMNLPMVFYCPDYGSYERDFYLHYDRDLPGTTVLESEQLLSALRTALANGGETETLKAFKEKEVGACDGHSTERVVKLITDYLQ